MSKKKPKTIGASYPLSFMGCEGEVIVEMTPTEAVSMIEKAWQENKRLRQENATLTAERDEARRDICSMMHMTGFLAGDYADSKGWDCFKDDHTGFSAEIQNFRDIFYGYKDELKTDLDAARKELIAYDALHGKMSVAAAAKARGWGYLIKENKIV